MRSIADYWGAHGPTEFEPGTGFKYSDPGVDVLGAVLEEVAGTSLDELAQRELFTPLGMTDADALIAEEQSADERFATVYMPQAPGQWKAVWEPGQGSIAAFTIGSGTTWYCTPADYARFLRVWRHASRMTDGSATVDGYLSVASARRALRPYAWVWPEAQLTVLYFTQSRGQRTRMLLEPLLHRLAQELP